VPRKRLYWLGLYHATCGDFIDWGVECEGNWSERLARFLEVAVYFPCPWHGSTSGLAAERLSGAVYLEENRLYYRPLAEGQEASARRNARLALSSRAA
jgi:hypothetical protein